MRKIITLTFSKGVKAKIALTTFLIAAAVTPSCAMQKEIADSSIDSTLELAADQYAYMKERLPEGKFPKTYYEDNDTFETSESGWWTSGFYPGTLYYLYESLNDPWLKQEADRILKDIEKEKHNTSTHDLGFMMFSSFGSANRLNPKEEYQEVLLKSAKSLSTRFDKDVGAIRSWNRPDENFVVIIDNMMNLELLFWASEFSGDDFFQDIAIAHADTTTENHFRPDHSSYHVVNYNQDTGEVINKRTAQGAADESAWARGQAWGLYGYTMMYREAEQQEYLDQAIKIADFMLDHPNLPEDKIPYWDFDAPNIPNALRDSSAGAITASALLELSEYVNEEKSEKYFDAAETMLKTLMSDEYLADRETNGGFILKHGVGHNPNNKEVDVPLTYGDYYFVEALLRYKEK